MKTSLPAMVFACTLVFTSQLVSAGCADQAQRNTALGHAIGVLVFDSIVKEYREFVAVKDIAAGLELASGSAFPLPITIEPDPDSTYSLSVAEARSIVTNWQPKSKNLDEEFLNEYKQPGQQKDRGILTRRAKLPVDGSARLSECVENFLNSTEGGLKQVCYMQLPIGNESVCDAEAHVAEALARPDAKWTYGEFNQDDVIAGWVEVFKLFKNKPEKFKHEIKSLRKIDGGTPKEGAKPEKVSFNLLEVVIPHELAYGEKGMIGKVEPKETLWFLMAVR